MKPLTRVIVRGFIFYVSCYSGNSLRHISSYKVPLIRRGITAILPYNMREFIPIVTVWLEEEQELRAHHTRLKRLEQAQRRPLLGQRRKLPVLQARPKQGQRLQHAHLQQRRGRPRRRGTLRPVSLPQSFFLNLVLENVTSCLTSLLR